MRDRCKLSFPLPLAASPLTAISPSAEGKLGRRRERRTGKDSSSRLSPVSLSANSLSPALPSLDILTEEGLLAVYSRALADVFEKNEKKNIKCLCLQVNKHPSPNKGKALGQNIRQAPLSNKRLTLLPHPLNFLNTVKPIKPSSSEIFLECDCVAQKRPIRFDKTKLQCSPCVLNFRCNSSCFPTNFPEIFQLLKLFVFEMQ